MKIKGVLAGHDVASNLLLCVTLIIGQYFDTIILGFHQSCDQN